MHVEALSRCAVFVKISDPYSDLKVKVTQLYREVELFSDQLT